MGGFCSSGCSGCLPLAPLELTVSTSLPPSTFFSDMSASLLAAMDEGKGARRQGGVPASGGRRRHAAAGRAEPQPSRSPPLCLLCVHCAAAPAEEPSPKSVAGYDLGEGLQVRTLCTLGLLCAGRGPSPRARMACLLSAGWADEPPPAPNSSAVQEEARLHMEQLALSEARAAGCATQQPR